MQKTIKELTENDIFWVESTLLNDQVSEDEELIELFTKELEISIKEAQKLINLRQYYLTTDFRKILPIREKLKEKKHLKGGK